MSGAMFVEIGRTGPALVGRVVSSKVTEREAPIIEAELSGSAEDSAWRMVVDLTEVGMLASAGLGMLVTLHRKCRDNSGKMAICGVSEDILGALKLSRLDRMLVIKTDLEAAVKAVA